MKKSTIIIIIAAIVLVLIASFIVVKVMNTPKESVDPMILKEQNDIAVETTDVSTIDTTTQEIDTSSFSDTALNDLG